LNRGRLELVVASSLLVDVRRRVVLLESLELVVVSLELMSVVAGGLVLVIVEVVDVVVPKVREVVEAPGSR
jgi:hypothetical protein